MTPPMTKANQSQKLQPFSFADKVVFIGAVAGVIPPVGSTGVEMVANEMEGELAMSGIRKEQSGHRSISEIPVFLSISGPRLTGGSPVTSALTSLILLQKPSATSAALPVRFPMRLSGETASSRNGTGTALDIFGEHSVSGGFFGG